MEPLSIQKQTDENVAYLTENFCNWEEKESDLEVNATSARDLG